MKIGTKILAVIGLLGCIMSAGAQNLSNRGKDFWVGYGHHQFMENTTNSMNMVLYLSAEQAANVTVTINGTAWVRNYAIPANTVRISDIIPKAGAVDARLFTVPCSFVPPGTPCGGEGVFTNKAIHIVSDVPIVAYAHIYGSASSGASMLMPVETWGYAYVTLNSIQEYAADCFSWAYVIAEQNNTVIEVTPTVTTRFGRPANVPYTVTLNRGEIYQFMAGPEAGGTKPELSGTKIRSIDNGTGNCHPIAVFAGSSRTRNPSACGAGGGDNDNQQCFPYQAWGKRYLTAPTSNSATPSTPMVNIYKIAVKDPTTIVSKNGVQFPLGSLINNSYYTYESNTADYIVADKPVMMAQYMSGGVACLGGASGVGDPEMMYLSPMEQGIKRIGFYRNTQENITVNYLTLIIPTAGVASLTIDGSNTFNHTYPHPNLPGYTVVVKRWSSALAQAIAQSDSAFTAVTYGLGSVESYGYNAGTLINNLSALGSIFNTSDTSTSVTSHPFTCTKTPVKLSVLLGYPTAPTKLIWQLSQLGAVLSPNTDVTVNSPVPDGPPVIVNGKTYLKFSLPGSYQFSNTGIYTIPIRATHPSIDNCNNTESVSFEVTVKAKPVAGFTFTHTGCVSDAVQFNGPNASNNGYTINQWLWTFTASANASTQNASHTFTTPGNQNVTLHVVSTEGCVSDSTRVIPIVAKPSAVINTVPVSATVCEGQNVTLTGVSAYTGTGSITGYYWDFGNATTNTTVGPHTVSYPVSGPYTVKFVSKVSATCISDTAVKIINVSPPPTTTFSYPAGCLPAGGAVTFTSSAASPDGTPLASHAWNFGDPGSGALNTSTLASPTHIYSNFGNYTITYSVTTAGGCTKDTTVNATFNIRPTFNYPVLPAVCYDVPSVSVATATVTNGVTGTGIYRGPGTTAAGVLTPSVAGAGTHTIWYVFTSNAGCKDSISRTITVHPRIGANFVIPTATCLPVSGNVQFNYSGTLSAGQQYLWNFGDPGSGAANTSVLQNPTHNYTTGNFTISLTVTATNGCKDDTTMTTNFTVKPALTYPALTAVCESVSGTVSVATASVTNGVPGTGEYHGPATTLTGTFTPSLAGAGTHTIWYVFTATGNCKDSVSRTIVVYAKPSASFTYTSAACLPTNGLVQFTYNGSLSPGQTYAWNFGDPGSGALNTSALQNPTHNYTSPGNYNLTVTVTNANGCIDDSLINTNFSIKPALTYPPLTAICESVTGTVSVATASVTNGIPGTGEYHGPATTLTGTFTPSLAGAGTHTIWYVFTATGNCKDSVSRTIVVYAKPSASFTYTSAACLPTTGLVQFTYNGSVSPGQTYAWNFGDPGSGALNTSALQNPTHNYTSPGNYNLTVTVTNANGCVDDSLINTNFSIKPALTYPALPAVCESVTGTVSVATASVTNGIPGTGEYHGPATTLTGNFSPSLAGAGTHTIWYVFTATGNCKDSVSRTIVVYAKPFASFTYTSAACLPTTGLVQFTYNGSVSPGQTYAWNFGDPASGALNTSAVQNPTHNYSNTGNHTLTLTVTNTNGCVDDSITNAVFSVKPALAFPVLTAVCESVTGTISVANATVTNGVTGTGVYHGPATTAAGLFTPSVAGAGNHTIWYVFTSTANCKDSISQVINVKPKPFASYTLPATGCIPASGLVQFTYNGSVTPGQLYAWNFGDPASGAANTSALPSPSHVYSNTGSHSIQLTVTGTNGCSDDSVIVRTYSVTPALAYTALTSVCESVTGTVSVANASVTNGVSGTGVYSGPGTNAAGNFSPSAAGPGTHTITYTFTSTGNCITTITKQITVFAKPTATFTATASICLNQQVSIAGITPSSPGSINSWKWFFGDASTAINNNNTSFTRPYTAFGNYTIKLVTVNTNGCTSDTASKPVAVHSMPVADFTLPASVCMPGATNITNASSSPDGSALTYAWDFDDASAIDNSTNPSHTYAVSGSYDIALNVTSAFGCVTNKVKTFSAFFDKPIADFDVNPTSLCQGNPNSFTDRSTAPGSSIASHLWTFGDNSTSADPSPSHTYALPGVYTVQLQVTSNENCVSNPLPKIVTVYPQPVVDAGPSFVVAQGTHVQFKPVVNDSTGVVYTWDPGFGLSNANALRPIYIANADQEFTLYAVGAGNCTASDKLSVEIYKPVKVPNAFSPNGDRVHDLWDINNINDYPEATVEVFNRYGQSVYRSAGYAKPWDGNYNGKPLPVATYYYVIKLGSGFQPMSGSVTILR